jgi:hypothetical protein
MSWIELIACGALVAWTWVSMVLFRAQRKRIERLEHEDTPREYRLTLAERQGENIIFTPPAGSGWVLHSASVKWNSLDLVLIWVR